VQGSKAFFTPWRVLSLLGTFALVAVFAFSTDSLSQPGKVYSVSSHAASASSAAARRLQGVDMSQQEGHARVLEEEGGEESKDKQINDQSNLSISIMLMGSMSFMMALFYLVNSPDKEFRRYSWRVVSSTISIFSAVLLFQAVNGCVEYASESYKEGMDEEAKEDFGLVISFAHFITWFIALQFVLAIISGAISNPFGRKRNTVALKNHSKEVIDVVIAARKIASESNKIQNTNDGLCDGNVKAFYEPEINPHKTGNVDKEGNSFNDSHVHAYDDVVHKFRDEVAAAVKNSNGTPVDPVQFHEQARLMLRTLHVHKDAKEINKKLDMSCWATMFGHIVGFAAIHAFAELQGRWGKKGGAFWSTFTIVFGFFVMGGMFIISKKVRQKVSLSDDGGMDASEEEWEEATAETENDSLCLMLSFLITQVIRQVVSTEGALPDAEGNEPKGQITQHPWTDAALLIGVGIALLVWMAVRVIFFSNIKLDKMVESETEGGKKKKKKRSLSGLLWRAALHCICSLLSAWSTHGLATTASIG